MTFEQMSAQYVVKRTDQGGGYLQPTGSAKSYGTKLKARRFPSREAAQAECCENERPEPL